MKITFWGVRGSVPVPGLNTVKFGGNTACVSINIGNVWLVIDTGTGIRPLGEFLAKTPNQEVYLLFTHIHHDHIQGLPYFEPFYTNDTKIRLVPYRDESTYWSPLELFDGIHFPLTPDRLAGDIEVVENLPVELFESLGISISRIPVNHPGGGFGYRFSYRGQSFVHVPDNELNCTAGFTVSTYRDFVEFCANASILSHDSHLRERDLPKKKGWGHSNLANLVQLAKDARVSHLVPFHHDPERTDEMLTETQTRLREHLNPHGIQCTVAYEGLQFSFY